MNQDKKQDVKFVAVCHAKNDTEAGYLVSVLKGSGINAYREDEYRTSIAWGAVPPTDLHNRILVPKTQFQEASTILDKLKSEAVPLNDNQPPLLQEEKTLNKTSLPTKSRGTLFFILGLIAGILVTSVIILPSWRHIKKRHGTDEFDMNNDGKIDTWVKYQGSIWAKEFLKDCNGDGKIDWHFYYDKYGNTEMMESDNDYDGKFETRGYYKDDLLISNEVDLNGDGKPDWWNKYKDGRLVESMWDTNFDSKIDKWSCFDKGFLIRSEWDMDGDGKPDKIKYYDRFENEIQK